MSVCSRQFLLSSVALVGALAIVTAPGHGPHPVAAFSLLGHHLDTTQRDFRVVDAFADASANDNTIEHPAFPGTTGAVLAIRKAHAEWGSGPWQGHGLGDGLASNPILGSGGANFDQHFAGLATTPIGQSENVHRPLSSGTCGGGILSFTQFSASGWTINYCEQWNWSDGPGLPLGDEIDLQAIATREIGRSLGLANSSALGATMGSVLSGPVVNLRSIETDDIAGLAAIYGAASGGKPVILDVTGDDTAGGLLVIEGANFDPTDNQVWFPSPGSSGDAVVLGGVPSTAGGTRINVFVPGGVDVGDLLVKLPGVGGGTLSNSWPLAPGSPPGRFSVVPSGVAAADGQVPQLSGSGDLSPGSATGFVIDLDLAAASTFGVLFVGAGEAAIPFKGGVFVPAPVVTELPFTSTASGGLHLAAAFPAGTPGGVSAWSQVWLADASGPAGATASNGLRLDLP